MTEMQLIQKEYPNEVIVIGVQLLLFIQKLDMSDLRWTNCVPVHWKNFVRACTLLVRIIIIEIFNIVFYVSLNKFLRLIVDDVYVRKTIRARSSDQNEAEMNESNFDQYWS